MFRFLKSQSRPLRSQTPPRQLQQYEVGSIQRRYPVGNEESVKGELTAEHHLGRAQSLSDVSNAECGESSHRGGHTGESKERRIWGAGSHIGRRMCGWGGVRTSSRSSASSSERRVNYRIRKSADAVRNRSPSAWSEIIESLCWIHNEIFGLAKPGHGGKLSPPPRL